MTDSACGITDFRNSYIINSSEIGGHPCNTCRTQVLASCTLIDQASGHARPYYLGKACIGEHMYLDGGIAQVPTSEVCITFGEHQYKLQKKFADHRDDVIHIATPQEEVRLFDGRTAVWSDLRFEIRKADAVRLDSVESMIRAIEQLKSLVAMTTIAGAAGTHDAVLEYPIGYMNFRPDRKAIQVDVGPMLFPGTAGDVASGVEGLQLAYIMCTGLDRAEFVVRAPTQIGETSGARTLHYSEIIHTAAQTSVYAIDL